jgi:hypothetical protein
MTYLKRRTLKDWLRAFFYTFTGWGNFAAAVEMPFGNNKVNRFLLKIC